MELNTLVDFLFQGYRTLQETSPLLGSMLTAEAVFPLGDIASQLILDRKVDWRKVRYTAKLAPAYGMGTYGLMETGDLVGEYISAHPLAKAALGPNLFANAYNLFFFANNGVGERKGYSVEALAKHYFGIVAEGGRSVTEYWSRFKEKVLHNVPPREYLNSVLSVVTVWNAFQWYNYSSVPENLRTPFTLAASLGWTVLLSFWSLQGRKKLMKSDSRVKE